MIQPPGKANQAAMGTSAAARPLTSDVDAFRTLVQRLTGLHFDEWRRSTLETSLIARMWANNIADPGGYMDLLSDPARRGAELGDLLDLLTVNETCFFRYPFQFDFLREQALPALIEKRNKEGRAVCIWSAGCSTGEEPYSIAMATLDVLGSSWTDSVEIHANDVSTAALNAARRGEYSEKSLRLLDGAYRSKYFRQVADGRFAVCETVKRMVKFNQFSLVDAARQAMGWWDIIFCRNVLIYFAQGLATQILGGIAKCLADDGHLFVGHSELIDRTLFVPRDLEGAFVYRKVPAGTAALAPRPVRATGNAPARPTRPRPPVKTTAPTAPPRGNPDKLFAEALERFDLEAYAQAQSQLDRLLRLFPRHVPGTLLRSNVYLNLGQHERSVEECEVVLQVDPLAFEAYLLLGMNFHRLAKPEAAIAELRKAAYIAPDSCAVQFHLAEAYRGSQMWSEARRAYQNALTTLAAADERDVRTYAGGFGKPTLKTYCEQMIASSPESGRQPI